VNRTALIIPGDYMKIASQGWGKRISFIGICQLLLLLYAHTAFSEEEKPMNTQNDIHIATFAGGCFWCMQPPFDNCTGVISTRVGYTGGHVSNPTYKQVCTGTTGHTEAVEVSYDPAKVSYDSLLAVFWRNIDPTDKNGQFADHGFQYRTVIFYHDDEQKEQAFRSKESLERSKKFKKPITVAIEPARPFYVAEDYHQKYYQTNKAQYLRYKKGSGREDFIKLNWPEK
jgi:methionine-S-sulfoxide reductase